MTLKAVTANRLGDGRVVYLTRLDGWSVRLGDALTARDEAGAAGLVADAERSVADQQVIGPYLIDIEHRDGGLAPVRYREAIRADGPSVGSEDEIGEDLATGDGAAGQVVGSEEAN